MEQDALGMEQNCFKMEQHACFLEQNTTRINQSSEKAKTNRLPHSYEKGNRDALWHPGYPD